MRGGTTATAPDFAPAFLIVAGISALAALVFRRLPADAGAEVSGRQVAPESLTLSERN